MLFFILLCFLAFSTLVLFVISSSLLGFLLTRVPFVTTADSDIRFISGKLSLGPKDYFFDLGSGDGKVIFTVEKLSGARAKGFELTWWTYLISKLKVKILKSKAQFYCRDFFKQDWSEATVIYGYLYPPLMGRVEEKFKAEMRPGSMAVIRDFPFPRLVPTEVISRPHNHKLYFYKI